MQKINFYLDQSPKNSRHNDLIIEIKDKNIQKSVDTYYFALDENFLENNESQKKVILALIVYLNILIDEVKKLDNSKNKLLFPIDFSDEYIGFLIISKSENDELKINYGITTSLQGYSYYPTKFKDFDQNVEIDHIDEWNFHIPLNKLISDTNSSIQNIKKQIKV